MKHKWFVLFVVLLTGGISLRSAKGWQDGRLAAGGASAPSLWVNVSALDFGPVPVGQTGWWFFTFKNIGNAPLNLTENATFAAPFSGTPPACATNLVPGSICTYVVQFSPTETGFFDNRFQFETDAGPFSIQMYGEGRNPHFYVNPLSLNFGSVLVGNSQTQSATIYNTGAYHLDLTTSSPPSPDFGSSSGDCSGGVSPGDSCTVYLNFEPTQSGTLTDTYTINTVAGDIYIHLQGSGRTVPFLFGPHQQVTPRSLDFGPVPLGDSKTLTVTITNQSFDTAVTGWAGGGVTAPFSASQNCASGLPVGESCQFFYTFTPTEETVSTETSNVSNSAGGFNIGLQGEAVWSKPLINETILNFGPLSSVNQEASLHNIGHTRLYLNDVTVSDPMLFSPSWGCGSGIPPQAPNNICSITYGFSITAPGFISETSTISTDGGDVTITLKAGAQTLILEQAFVPDQIVSEGTSTLQYSITNPNEAATYYFVALSNTLPMGITYADPLSFSASPACGAPALLPVAGNPPTFMISSGTILGGATCTISLDVTAAADGLYTNIINFAEGGTDPNDDTWTNTSSEATATLTVGQSQLYLPVMRKP